MRITAIPQAQHIAIGRRLAIISENRAGIKLPAPVAQCRQHRANSNRSFAGICSVKISIHSLKHDRRIWRVCGHGLFPLALYTKVGLRSQRNPAIVVQPFRLLRSLKACTSKWPGHFDPVPSAIAGFNVQACNLAVSITFGAINLSRAMIQPPKSAGESLATDRIVKSSIPLPSRTG